MKTSKIDLLEQNAMLNRAIVGIEILEERLTNLIEELKLLARNISTNQDELIELDLGTMYSLGMALADEGDLVRRFSDIAKDDVQVLIERERKYGIDLPILISSSQTPSDHKIEIPLTMSTSVLTARDKFENLYFSYLNYVEQVILLQRLARDIKKTRRQIMVLEYQIVPELKHHIAKIKLALDEQEREEQIRLRKAKKRSK